MQDERWKDVMKKEIHALEENRTWTLEIERYKARLVAKGFTQREGVDYHDTFAPVAKLVTVRTPLAVATKKKWIINQLDVNNAFLNEDLNEEVNMKIPQGFSKEGETRVCRLRKSIYGIKQASRNWYQKFTTALLNLGFRQCKADYSLFIFKQENSFVAVLLYVDDVIMVRNDKDKIYSTKNDLNKRFSIKDLGILKYFFSIEVTRTSKGMVLSQRKYTLDIIEDCANPRQSHLEAVHHVLRYLKATPGQGVLLPIDEGYNLTAYSDSDWLGCPFTRRYRTGYNLLLGGAPISWKTKNNMWFPAPQSSELDVFLDGPTPLFCDNQAASHIANNPVFHERTKHGEMDCYFVRERVESKEVNVFSIDSKMQIADLFTKGLGAPQLNLLLGKLGIINMHTPT
ncbi:putative RNA-directed DNA polymerase [Tanacetum coccineum]